MKLDFATLSSGALGLLIPAAAFAAINVGDQAGTNLDEVRANFEAQGYTVLEIEAEDDEIEVEYTFEGQTYEATVAAATGIVMEVELEDDEDDD